MKTESKNLGSCQYELIVTLDAEEAKKIYDRVEKSFLRNARIPGFRPGKAPIEIIRKEFASDITAEANVAMIRENVNEAIKAESLDCIGDIQIAGSSCTQDSGTFTVRVDVRPTFKLPAYKGLKIEHRDVTVKQEAVDAQIADLRKSWKKYEDSKEGDTVAEGDFAQIDYSGTVGGKSILEINPEAKFVASGTGFWVRVEDGYFLPEIVEAVKGMKVGETKEGVKAKFDKESAPEGLKGEKAEYTITLSNFRRAILPSDEEMAKNIGMESYEKFVEFVRNQMQRVADEQEANRRENTAVELLLKKASFDLPQSFVKSLEDDHIKELSKRAQESGIDANYFKENKEKISKDAHEYAEKQARWYFIAEAIAKEEKIEGKEGESFGRKVIDFVLANAKQ